MFDGESAALGPVVPWQETWRSAARAGSALALAAEGLLPAEGLLLTDQHLPELALFRDRRLLDDLAAIGLRPLDGRTAGARARLLETLGSWLDHQGRVPDVARALHVHPQTVRYRLAQLREAFGPALDDPRGRFELALARAGPGRGGAAQRSAAAGAGAGPPDRRGRRHRERSGAVQTRPSSEAARNEA